MTQVLVGEGVVGGPGTGALELLDGSVVLVVDPLGLVGTVLLLVGSVVLGAVVVTGGGVVLDGGGGGGGGDPPPPTTVMVPVIAVWNRQWKVKVPAVVKVNEYVLPAERSGEFQRPSSLVVLCTVPSVSLFTQVTLSPTLMVSELGLNCTFLMLIV
ncbi:MAG TPA: hypothetical protein VG317_00390 [Pseudonocardiaceae bacterium]|jgi:hypothetical protein|nr:hypothetical protein [Pseudonocardiaceae bacterium]